MSIKEAIVLCGGQGTRLNGALVPGTPKCLAEVAGVPFMDHLIEKLREAGIRRVVLAVGYGRELIRSRYGKSWKRVEVVYSEETEPLGTAGALRQALQLIDGEYALAVNGDSCFRGDGLCEVLRQVLPAGGGAVLLALLDGTTHYCVAGYVLSKKLDWSEHLRHMEREAFPYCQDQGLQFANFVSRDTIIDIGTPETLQRAELFLEKHHEPDSSDGHQEALRQTSTAGDLGR